VCFTINRRLNSAARVDQFADNKPIRQFLGRHAGCFFDADGVFFLPLQHIVRCARPVPATVLLRALRHNLNQREALVQQSIARYTGEELGVISRGARHLGCTRGGSHFASKARSENPAGAVEALAPDGVVGDTCPPVMP
jgi:hypothetical protein